jgi:hypothetical protein
MKTDLGISDIRVAAALTFVVLNIAVFLIRLISVMRYGALFPFDSVLPIYAVWRGIHHLQIYEWPFAFPFHLAPYNYLFYETYAFYLRFVGATGASMLMWGRLFTPVFSIIGAIAQWKLVQYQLKLRGARSVLSLIFSLGIWFCASMVDHWALSIRPDMGAVALVMVALWLIVRKPPFCFAYSGVLFYLAWSFKQSVVLALVGVFLFLLFHKRWHDFFILVTVFAALTATTLILGTPEYRFDTLVATRLYGFSIPYALQIAPKSIFGNLYWILAPIALLRAAGTRRLDGSVRLLITVFAVAFVCGVAELTKVGGWDNYLLEAFVAGSTLLQIATFTAPGLFVSALVLFGCAQPAIQLIATQSGPHVHALGTVGIATPAEYADAEAMRDLLAQMKKPIFSDDPSFSLPWFSTDNQSPALVVDLLFLNATRARCENGCIEGLLLKGEIPTVMLLSSGDPFQNSLNPGYKMVGEARESDRLWSIYEFAPPMPVPDLLKKR